MGKSTLSEVLRKKYGGLVAVKENLKYPASCKPAGYWSKQENVLAELNEIISTKYQKDGKVTKEAGKFPTAPFLQGIGKGYLVAAITTHHGGFAHFRDVIGYKGKQERFYFKKWENLEAKLKEVINQELCDKTGKIIKKLGEFPTRMHLKSICLGYIYDHIAKYHNGLPAVRKKMGYEPARLGPVPKSATKPLDKFTEPGNLEEQTLLDATHYPKTAASSIDREIPEDNKTRRRSRGSFDKLGIELIQVLLSEYKDPFGKIIKKVGDFPTMPFLESIGKKYLVSAIDSVGGIVKVKKRIKKKFTEYTQFYRTHMIRGEIEIQGKSKKIRGLEDRVNQTGKIPEKNNLVDQQKYDTPVYDLPSDKELLEQEHEKLERKKSLLSEGVSPEQKKIDLAHQLKAKSFGEAVNKFIETYPNTGSASKNEQMYSPNEKSLMVRKMKIYHLIEKLSRKFDMPQEQVKKEVRSALEREGFLDPSLENLFALETLPEPRPGDNPEDAPQD